VAAGFLLLRRVAPAWAAFGGLVTGLAVLPAFRPSPAALGAALASAIPLAVEVLLILYGGIALFAVLRLTGLHQVLGQGVASLAPDRPRRVLLVALGVAPFLESVIGFGVGMIMAAPNCGSLGSRRGWPRWWPCWPWSAYRGALGPRARWSRQNWPASTSTPSAPPPPA